MSFEPIYGIMCVVLVIALLVAILSLQKQVHQQRDRPEFFSQSINERLTTLEERHKKLTSWLETGPISKMREFNSWKDQITHRLNSEPPEGNDGLDFASKMVKLEALKRSETGYDNRNRVPL